MNSDSSGYWLISQQNVLNLPDSNFFSGFVFQVAKNLPLPNFIGDCKKKKTSGNFEGQKSEKPTELANETPLHVVSFFLPISLNVIDKRPRNTV